MIACTDPDLSFDSRFCKIRYKLNMTSVLQARFMGQGKIQMEHGELKQMTS
jgi:hypothetical protein